MKFCSILAALAVLLFSPFSVLAGSQGVSQGSSEPSWPIMKDGTGHPVKWVDHAPNPRFAIYDAGTPADPTDDAVLDKETGLLWERQPSDVERAYRDSTIYVLEKHVAGRFGWRVPTAEEFMSILDPVTTDHLTPGHPFLILNDPNNFDWYWTSTPASWDRVNHYVVNLADGGILFVNAAAEGQTHLVWSVRGGQ